MKYHVGCLVVLVILIAVPLRSQPEAQDVAIQIGGIALSLGMPKDVVIARLAPMYEILPNGLVVAKAVGQWIPSPASTSMTGAC
jgi:hypothetical protein